MYRCNWCECEFEEPSISVETHGLDTPPYEEISVCPNCGDTDFDEFDEDEEEDEEDE